MRENALKKALNLAKIRVAAKIGAGETLPEFNSSQPFVLQVKLKT